VLTVLAVLAVLAVLFVAAAVATHEGDVLVDAPPDDADLVLPDTALQPEDVAEVRFGMAVRGYRMAEVDRVLARLATELAVRDTRVAALEQALVDAVEPTVAEVEQPRPEPDPWSQPELVAPPSRPAPAASLTGPAAVLPAAAWSETSTVASDEAAVHAPVAAGDEPATAASPSEPEPPLDQPPVDDTDAQQGVDVLADESFAALAPPPAPVVGEAAEPDVDGQAPDAPAPELMDFPELHPPEPLPEPLPVQAPLVEPEPPVVPPEPMPETAPVDDPEPLGQPEPSALPEPPLGPPGQGTATAYDDSAGERTGWA
jgi:DivIVA domain-containing protein